MGFARLALACWPKSPFNLATYPPSVLAWLATTIQRVPCLIAVPARGNDIVAAIGPSVFSCFEMFGRAGREADKEVR